MTTRIVFSVLLLGLAAITEPVAAARSIVSGEFSESDTLLPRQHDLRVDDGFEFCSPPVIPTEDIYPYQVIGPLTASEGGTYTLDGIDTRFTQDTVFTLYEAPPNPDDLSQARVGAIGEVVPIGNIDLQAGQDYYVFAQPYCGLRTEVNQRVWALHFEGPGVISGDQTVTIPEIWSGSWSSEDPTMVSAQGCPDDRPFTVLPPQQFEKNGLHEFSPLTAKFIGEDISLLTDLVVSVYDGPFDPATPEANRIDVMQVQRFFGWGRIFERNKDFTLVVQPWCGDPLGEWSLIRWPRGPIALNSEFTGTYADLSTLGQGILLTVDEESPLSGEGQRFVFGAWFTWVTEEANVEEPTATFGDPNQRWLVLSGNYEPSDSSMNLQITTATGGVFNDPAAVSQPAVGTATLNIEDCENATLSYQFDSGRSGTTDMVRLIDTLVEDCYARSTNYPVDVFYD